MRSLKTIVFHRHLCFMLKKTGILAGVELHNERIPRSLSERSVDPDPSVLERSWDIPV